MQPFGADVGYYFAKLSEVSFTCTWCEFNSSNDVDHYYPSNRFHNYAVSVLYGAARLD